MKFHYLAILGVLLVVCVSGCAVTGTVTDENTIQFGSILILTGLGSTWGESTRQGIDLAVSEVNANGGVLGKKLEIIYENDESDPRTAIDAYRKLRSVDNVDFILGPTWSHVGMAVAEAAQHEDVVVMSPTIGMETFNELSENIFKLWPHDALLSEAVADVVFEHGHRRVALASVNVNYANWMKDAFVKRFEELGGEIVVVANPHFEMMDMRDSALKIQNADVDAIIFTGGASPQGAILAKRLAELHVAIPMYSISLDAEVIEAAEGAYDGLIYLTSLTPTDEFSEKFESIYGAHVDIGADTGYDSVMMLVQAIEETQSLDPVVVSEYLNELQTYVGASGTLTADGKGAFEKEYVRMQVVEGQSIKMQ